MDEVLGSSVRAVSRCLYTMDLWCSNLRQWEGPSIHRGVLVHSLLVHVHMALMNTVTSHQRAVKVTVTEWQT